MPSAQDAAENAESVPKWIAASRVDVFQKYVAKLLPQLTRLCRRDRATRTADDAQNVLSSLPLNPLQRTILFTLAYPHRSSCPAAATVSRHLLCRVHEGLETLIEACTKPGRDERTCGFAEALHVDHPLLFVVTSGAEPTDAIRASARSSSALPLEISIGPDSEEQSISETVRSAREGVSDPWVRAFLGRVLVNRHVDPHKEHSSVPCLRPLAGRRI